MSYGIPYLCYPIAYLCLATRYWQVYETLVYPFYPSLVTMDRFEASLFNFLERRPELDGDEDLKQGIDISWLSLLFAILACGVQFSDDQVKERDLKSKVFGLFFDDFSQLREFKAN